MRVHRERGIEREVRLAARTGAEKDLGEVQHGGKMSRFELERAADVVQALLVAAEQVKKRGALVPGLGEVGRAAQALREARLCEVRARRRYVARSAIQIAGGFVVRMVHPHVPDEIFRRARLRGVAVGKAAKQLVKEREIPGSPAAPPGGNQCQDVVILQ